MLETDHNSDRYGLQITWKFAVLSKHGKQVIIGSPMDGSPASAHQVEQARHHVAIQLEEHLLPNVVPKEAGCVLVHLPRATGIAQYSKLVTRVLL